MDGTVVSANLKIKFDVFIEIRGRSTHPRRGIRVILHVVEPRREGREEGDGLIAQLRMMDLNSNVRVRRNPLTREFTREDNSAAFRKEGFQISPLPSPPRN